MNKADIAQALFKPWGHIFGGMSLIIMSLFMLGYMIDHLTKTFGAEMPFLASLAPLVVTLTGVAWGGVFIWKGADKAGVSFDIFCKWADKVVLNRMSRKARVLIGTPPVLAGVIVLIIAMIRTAIRSGFFETGTITLSITAGPLWPIGIGLLIFGLIVTHGIQKDRREDKPKKEGKCQ